MKLYAFWRRVIEQASLSSHSEVRSSLSTWRVKVCVHEARTDPRISLGLVRTHLARQPRRVEESDPADREALVVEISRRRNRIERAMRRFLREGLLFAHGKKAMNEALAALPEERRAVLTQFGYDQMWNELHFNELTSILDRHFSAFQR